MKHLYSLVLCILLIGSYSLLNAQDILWEKSIGGNYSEYLYDMKPTPDYGFVLAGSSLSQTKENQRGSLDYFVWKMDENGNQEWSKSFGAEGTEHLYSINLTNEGGFILGGSSDSKFAEDSTLINKGLEDIWLIKLDPNGEEQWQTTLGGLGSDKILSITQTKDEGYILGGTSNSPVSSQKKEAFGNTDFWIVKLDKEGTIEWEQTLGGRYSEILRSIHQTEDNGFILAGTSSSPPFSSLSGKSEGAKTSEHFGFGDYWVVKIDSDGLIEWEKTYGGKEDDQLFDLQPTQDGGYIIGGVSNSKNYGDKKASNEKGTDYWVLKIDETGTVLWDKTLDYGEWDVLVSVTPTKKGNYLLSGYSQTEKGEDYIAVKLSETGEKLWEQTIGGKGSDRLQKTTRARDGGYLLAGTSNSGKGKDKSEATNGQFDFWVVKLQDNDEPIVENEQLVEVYPNPTRQYSNVIIHEDYNNATTELFSLDGKFIQKLELKGRNNTVDLVNVPKGIYILKVTFDGQTIDKKIIKK